MVTGTLASGVGDSVWGYARDDSATGRAERSNLSVVADLGAKGSERAQQGTCCAILDPRLRHIRRPYPSRPKSVAARLESRQTVKKMERALGTVDDERSANSMCTRHVLTAVLPRHAKRVSASLSFYRSERLQKKRIVFISPKARHQHGHGRRGSRSRRRHHHGHLSEHRMAPTSPDPFAMGKSCILSLFYLDLLTLDAFRLHSKHSPMRIRISWVVLSQIVKEATNQENQPARITPAENDGEPTDVNIHALLRETAVATDMAERDEARRPGIVYLLDGGDD